MNEDPNERVDRLELMVEELIARLTAVENEVGIRVITIDANDNEEEALSEYLISSELVEEINETTDATTN